MTTRQLHVIHLLIRRRKDDGAAFLVCPHDKWLDAARQPYVTLPTKRSVTEPFAPFLQGTSVEAFVDHVAQKDLGLTPQDYVLERELEAVVVTLPSPTQHIETHYTIYPVDVWVAPVRLGELTERVTGEWLSCDQANGR